MSEPNTTSRVSIRRPSGVLDPFSGLAEAARAGLTAQPRWLPSKFHYDARGSEIFEQITELPEYYQTRTERAILESIADDLVAGLEPRALVEFGSGSAFKTRVLLDAMARRGLLEAYGAIEVSESALVASAHDLVDRYDGLVVDGVLTDFLGDVELPCPGLPRLVLFLGSTIGNLRPPDAVTFLRKVRERMNPEDGFLIGFDLVKDRATVVAAYNDAQGVTEQFSLNLLRVLNRELGADFPLRDFRHLAIYNDEKDRIESYVIARRPVTVRIEKSDLVLELQPGDRIRTELSHKYTRESVTALTREAGLDLTTWRTDPRDLFAVALTRPSDRA